MIAAMGMTRKNHPPPVSEKTKKGGDRTDIQEEDGDIESVDNARNGLAALTGKK